jgi:hypothetical protein
MKARSKAPDPDPPMAFDVAVWDHEGNVVKAFWDVTYEEAVEIEEEYADDPLRTVVVDDRLRKKRRSVGRLLTAEQYNSGRVLIGPRPTDPDYTEGRAIAHAEAEALARAQLAMSTRSVRLKEPEPAGRSALAEAEEKSR